MAHEFLVDSDILDGTAWAGYVRRAAADRVEFYPSVEHAGEPGEQTGAELRPVTSAELLRLDPTLAGVLDLPPLTQAWRGEAGGAFTTGRLPTGPTYFFGCDVRLAPDHPDRDDVGEEAMLSAWIRCGSAAEARAILDRELADARVTLDHLEGPDVYTAADYQQGSQALEYFEQAQTDGEVFIYYHFPRYPAYWVHAVVRDDATGESAEAHYFVCGTSLVEDEDLVQDRDFWSGPHAEAALNLAHEAISESGWSVVSVPGHRPCGPQDLPEDLLPYYDDAEEEGECLVFVQDDPEAGGT